MNKEQFVLHFSSLRWMRHNVLNLICKKENRVFISFGINLVENVAGTDITVRKSGMSGLAQMGQI